MSQKEHLESPAKIILYMRNSIYLAVALLVFFACVLLSYTINDFSFFSDSSLDNQRQQTTGTESVSLAQSKDKSIPSFNVDTLPEIPDLDSAFKINDIKQYTIQIAEGMEYQLSVAQYSDEFDVSRNAIIYLPPDGDGEDKEGSSLEQPEVFRYEKWQASASAINQYTSSDSTFISFWDNAQRIHLLTGRNSWSYLPAQEAYETTEQLRLWEQVAAGLDNTGHSKLFAEYLLMDGEQALNKLEAEELNGSEHYLFISTDDLAHVQEIAYLNQTGLPLETRLFPANADLHNSISQVKDWAREGEGTGSYLVQSLSEQTIRAWRITDKAFENSLLVRLLPFSTSLDKPLERLRLVYQSDWGGYISIYQIHH